MLVSLMGLKVILITGRKIPQAIASENMRTKGDYTRDVAICELDPADLMVLNVREGTPIRVRTDHGSVVVYAMASTQSPHPSVAFMPVGPWANQVISPETDGIGMPSYKGVPAEIESAEGETVLDAISLLRNSLRN